MKPYIEEKVKKSILFEKDLHDKIMKTANDNQRDFSKQIQFICKKYFEMIEK